MSEIDQQFIEYVVKSLVGKPDAVSIKRTIDEKGVLLELTVDPDDLGRVIGKRGATAQSLRTLLRALGTKNDARYNLKIIDNGPDDAHRRGDDNVTDHQAQPEPVADTEEPEEEQSDSQEAPANEEHKKAEEPEDSEEPASDGEPEPEAPVEESAPEDEASDRLARTRKELADLDDLDV